MSARDDYPWTRDYALALDVDGPVGSRSELSALLDEIDRLRAQVERDRPVIHAARALVAVWGRPDPESGWEAEQAAEEDLADAVAAFYGEPCAPDEVNEQGTA